MRRALAFGLLALLAGAAHAQPQRPNPADTAVVMQCLQEAGKKGKSQESCLGVVSDPCLENDKNNTADMTVCHDREYFVWADILERIVGHLRQELDAERKAKFEDMQAKWEASRTGTCSFYRDYFQGSIAGPLVVGCLAEETGRRALQLTVFLNDTGFLDGKNK